MRLRGAADSENSEEAKKSSTRLGPDWEPSYQEGHPTLWAAARCGDRKTVDALLSTNRTLTIDSSDDDGRTALHWAVAAGHKALALDLLARGARSDTADASGWSPLHSAAGTGDAALLRALLAACADPAAAAGQRAGESGATPLHIACGKVRRDAAAELLAVPAAPVDAADESGATPFMVGERGRERRRRRRR
jgi:ankyrin repeat protein